jgi:hypothetical protein
MSSATDDVIVVVERSADQPSLSSSSSSPSPMLPPPHDAPGRDAVAVRIATTRPSPPLPSTASAPPFVDGMTVDDSNDAASSPRRSPDDPTTGGAAASAVEGAGGRCPPRSSSATRSTRRRPPSSGLVVTPPPGEDDRAAATIAALAGRLGAAAAAPGPKRGAFANAACGGIRSALFRGGRGADSDEEADSRGATTSRNVSADKENAERDVDGRPPDAVNVTARFSSFGWEMIAGAEGRGGRRTKGRKLKRKRGRPQKRGMEEVPRQHPNDVVQVHLNQSHYLASTSEGTPVSSKAHDKASFQSSHVFQWSPITLRSPAKKTKETLDASPRGAVGPRDASDTHPPDSGAWSHRVLTMRVFTDDGRGGTHPTAATPERRTDTRRRRPLFSPILLRSLDDSPTNVRHPRGFPQELTVRTPTRDQGGDDPIHSSNWHTPNSIAGDASLPSSDIDDLIACFGDDYD